jgi:hypothetical protein
MLKQVNGILGKKHKCQNDFLSKIFFIQNLNISDDFEKTSHFCLWGRGDLLLQVNGN